MVLTSLMALPLMAAAIIGLIGDERQPLTMQAVALLSMLISLGLCVQLCLQFNPQNAAMQCIERVAWLPALNLYYQVGVDGLSLLLVLLSTFTSFVVLLSGFESIKTQQKHYLMTFLLMQTIMVGVFVAMDAILYFIFWEMSLIPIYFAIGIWGSQARIYASFKFFLYTFAGSAMLLIALLYLGSQAQSFLIQDFYHLPLTENTQLLIFAAFFLGFAVKIPMWPVHTWLPDAHTEAPAGGSMILAAVMLKMGAYGFLRFALPIVPDAARLAAPAMVALSLIAIIYIGMVAIVQTDMKRLVAYSSISHMGFVTLGSFVIYSINAVPHQPAEPELAMLGAILQMISHGFSSAALFLGIGMLYDRLHTRQISDFGGVVQSMPVFTSFLMLFAMANVGLPGTSGFVGEFMVILASSRASFWVAAAAATTLLWAAGYTLWMYRQVFFGTVTRAAVGELTDATTLECICLTALAAGVLLMGLYPQPLVHFLSPAVSNLTSLGLATKL